MNSIKYIEDYKLVNNNTQKQDISHTPNEILSLIFADLDFVSLSNLNQCSKNFKNSTKTYKLYKDGRIFLQKIISECKQRIKIVKVPTNNFTVDLFKIIVYGHLDLRQEQANIYKSCRESCNGKLKISYSKTSGIDINFLSESAGIVEKKLIGNGEEIVESYHYTAIADLIWNFDTNLDDPMLESFFPVIQKVVQNLLNQNKSTLFKIPNMQNLISAGLMDSTY